MPGWVFIQFVYWWIFFWGVYFHGSYIQIHGKSKFVGWLFFYILISYTKPSIPLFPTLLLIFTSTHRHLVRKKAKSFSLELTDKMIFTFEFWGWSVWDGRGYRIGCCGNWDTFFFHIFVHSSLPLGWFYFSGGRTIIFTEKRESANELSGLLPGARALHGEIQQSQREVNFCIQVFPCIIFCFSMSSMCLL